MKSLINQLINLLKVKSIVTFVIIAVFAILALRGDIDPNDVNVVVASVIAFYFGTQHEKSGKGDGDV